MVFLNTHVMADAWVLSSLFIGTMEIHSSLLSATHKSRETLTFICMFCSIYLLLLIRFRDVQKDSNSPYLLP